MILLGKNQSIASVKLILGSDPKKPSVAPTSISYSNVTSSSYQAEYNYINDNYDGYLASNKAIYFRAEVPLDFSKLTKSVNVAVNVQVNINPSTVKGKVTKYSPILLKQIIHVNKTGETYADKTRRLYFDTPSDKQQIILPTVTEENKNNLVPLLIKATFLDGLCSGVESMTAFLDNNATTFAKVTDVLSAAPALHLDKDGNIIKASMETIPDTELAKLFNNNYKNTFEINGVDITKTRYNVWLKSLIELKVGDTKLFAGTHKLTVIIKTYDKQTFTVTRNIVIKRMKSSFPATAVIGDTRNYDKMVAPGSTVKIKFYDADSTISNTDFQYAWCDSATTAPETGWLSPSLYSNNTATIAAPATIISNLYIKVNNKPVISGEPYGNDVAVAYSLRRLNPSATRAINVRRTSGTPLTKDIGFDSNVNLNTNDLKNFVGTGNGYIVTWYDQSGNGRDATQTTTSRQPQIAVGGSVYMINGVPAVRFEGGGLFCDIPIGAEKSYYTVATKSGKPTSYLWGTDGAAASPALVSGYYSRAFEYFTQTGDDRKTISTPYGNGLAQISIRRQDSGGRYSIGLNGAEVVETHTTFDDSSASIRTIGCADTTFSSTFTGYISEFIMYSKVLNDTVDAAICNYQKSYYSLTPQMLDTIPGSMAAYSLRKLKQSAGFAIQVRRSSDNATRNIGFDANGNLDTTSLKTFVGTGTGYVTTWYDQSDNDNNATQYDVTTPLIVENGNVTTIQNHSSIKFTGGRWLNFTGNTLSGKNYSILAVVSRSENKNLNYFLGGNAPTNNGNLHFGFSVGALTGSKLKLGQFNNDLEKETKTYTCYNNALNSLNSLMQLSGINNDIGKEIYCGTNKIASDTNKDNLGSYGGASIGLYMNNSFNGNIGEIIIFNVALDETSRVTIVNSQLQYHGIQ